MISTQRTHSHRATTIIGTLVATSLLIGANMLLSPVASAAQGTEGSRISANTENQQAALTGRSLESHPRQATGQERLQEQNREQRAPGERNQGSNHGNAANQPCTLSQTLPQANQDPQQVLSLRETPREANSQLIQQRAEEVSSQASLAEQKVSPQADPAEQEVLSLLREQDPAGEQTLPSGKAITNPNGAEPLNNPVGNKEVSQLRELGAQQERELNNSRAAERAGQPCPPESSKIPPADPADPTGPAQSGPDTTTHPPASSPDELTDPAADISDDSEATADPAVDAADAGAATADEEQAAGDQETADDANAEIAAVDIAVLGVSENLHSASEYASADQLAMTGLNTTQLVLIAAGLLLAGGTLIFCTRTTSEVSITARR